MIPTVALWTAMLTALTSVKGVSVVPAEERTEVVIEVDGPVTIEDFTLDRPARLVVDVTGALQKLPRDRFTNIDRGGIRSLRVSQYRPQVVRIVLDLAQSVEYEVDQGNGEIRVSFPNAAGPFDAWHSTPIHLAGAADVLPAGPTPAQAAPVREAPAPRAPTPAPLRPARAARSEGPPITVFFKDTPVNDVIATFAEFSGRSIVVGQGVTGNLNADIREQPWDVALEALLQSYGLSLVELESGIIRVDKVENLREREKIEDLVTLPFPIKYASVDSLLPAIKDLLSERGKITRSSATNTLVVSDGKSVIEQRIIPMIEQLDVRTPQVTIAAKILFIDRTALEELGVAYDLKDTGRNQLNQLVSGYADTNGDGVLEPVDNDVVALRGSSIAALANAKQRIASPSLEILTSLALGRFQLINFLDVLSSLSVTDIQASPVVTTLDNREAHVQVGEETPIRVVDVGSASGGGAPPKANVQMKNTGIILRVTPHVTGNQVLLDLHAERSNIAVAPADIGYTFQKQESATQVLVDNGETAVISGLTIVEKSRVRSGIPILMNLPVLGKLFRTTTERESKKDLLIMVTPHIVRDGES